MGNRKEVIIHKNNKQASPFISLALESAIAAYKTLNDAEAFYLYILLCGNKDNYNMGFTEEQQSLRCGQPVSVLEKSFNKLVETGFLVQQGSGNVYDFYASKEDMGIYSEPRQHNQFAW